MDSKALRLSIAAIITTIVLVAVVVYAANIDRINELLGKKTDGAVTDEALETSEDATETVYGEQIGDNLKGFLTADDFFDKSEQRPSVVVVVDNVPVPANASSKDGTTDLSDVDENDKADEEYSYPDSEPEKKIEDELPLPEDKPLEKPEDKTGNDKPSLEDSTSDSSSTASSEENKPAETANSASTENTTGAASNESTSNATIADSTANTAGTESTTNAASTESTANAANTSSTESTAGSASTGSTSGN